jgi:hypothetical protein
MVFYWHLFTFALMKKQYTSQFFGLLVLFALLLQSVHSIHHLEEVFVEKKCHHDFSKNSSEITHSHNNLEHCFVCEFTFSNAVTASFFSFEHKNPVVSNSYSFFHSKEITQFFKGSLFALRAPPAFIV